MIISANDNRHLLSDRGVQTSRKLHSPIQPAAARSFCGMRSAQNNAARNQHFLILIWQFQSVPEEISGSLQKKDRSANKIL